MSIFDVATEMADRRKGVGIATTSRPLQAMTMAIGMDHTDKKGGIHINPANKGKFTATKKKTGKSTSQLTHSKNKLTRKRAVFAQNAKKWHHGKK